MMTREVQLFTKFGPEVREAAERVAQDWPSVTDTEELARDLALFLFEEERFAVLDTLPEYRRRKYLVDAARSLVANEVAEFEYSSGNSLYSVSEVKYLLKSGALINGRTKITAVLPDLDEGCQYLTRVLPIYSRIIFNVYVYGNHQCANREAIEASVRALTDCMNNLNQNRKERSRA